MANRAADVDVSGVESRICQGKHKSGNVKLGHNDRQSNSESEREPLTGLEVAGVEPDITRFHPFRPFPISSHVLP